jgi:hypothetical protein
MRLKDGKLLILKPLVPTMPSSSSRMLSYSGQCTVVPFPTITSSSSEIVNYSVQKTSGHTMASSRSKMIKIKPTGIYFSFIQLKDGRSYNYTFKDIYKNINNLIFFIL